MCARFTSVYYDPTKLISHTKLFHTPEKMNMAALLWRFALVHLKYKHERVSLNNDEMFHLPVFDNEMGVTSNKEF